MLLNFAKYSRPSIANMTQEFSKDMDGTYSAEYHEKDSVIKYELNTGNLGLKLKSKEREKEP